MLLGQACGTVQQRRSRGDQVRVSRHPPELPRLPDFYGATICRATIGPRREASLSVELWPVVDGQRTTTFRRGDGPRIKIRFGKIANIDQVELFFFGWE